LLQRETFLAALHDALEDAQGGRGQLVLVAGEAGVGKTARASVHRRRGRARARRRMRRPVRAAAPRARRRRRSALRRWARGAGRPWCTVVRGSDRAPARCTGETVVPPSAAGDGRGLLAAARTRHSGRARPADDAEEPGRFDPPRGRGDGPRRRGIAELRDRGPTLPRRADGRPPRLGVSCGSSVSARGRRRAPRRLASASRRPSV